MLSNYPAVFLEDANVGGYVVDFPDFECLATEGDTLDEVVAMAKDALAGQLGVPLKSYKNTPIIPYTGELWGYYVLAAFCSF